MNSKMILAAVFAFALCAAGIAFAQSAGGTATSSAESSAGADETLVPNPELAEPADDAPDGIAAKEQVQSKKKKNKSQNEPADNATVAADESGKPKKARDAPSAGTVQPEEGTRFKMGGLIEAGFDIHDRKDRGDRQNRVIGRGEIEVSARPVKKVRAELGIEYDVRDTFITVDKLYGQYNVTSDGTARAGLMKKSFGLEERAGVDERYFHRRSIINGKLEDLGFLGHDLTLMYRHEIDSTWRFAGGVSWSLDTAGATWSTMQLARPEDSTSYLQNYSAQYNPNPDMTFILAAVVKHLSYSGATTFASSLSFSYAAKPVESEAEITFGSRRWIERVPGGDEFDPTMDEYERTPLVFGARVQERFPIEIPSKIMRQVIPVVEMAAYWDDLKSDVFDAQLRIGLTFGFAKDSAFQLRNAFAMNWNRADGKTGASDVSRYRWDTEAVVIF